MNEKKNILSFTRTQAKQTNNNNKKNYHKYVDHIHTLKSEISTLFNFRLFISACFFLCRLCSGWPLYTLEKFQYLLNLPV